ncbi:hypothetical protein AB0H71_13845 [Nocardia sp. NPDC050697]|uniref:hypothetical protein n=1 Tax=Nocardia sp. NPDC050697 TaxID=3155158 RepID=UPI0033D595DE
MTDSTDGKPSDLEQLGPAMALVEDMRAAMPDDDIELLVPESMLVGVRFAYGFRLRHVTGIDCVYVAKRAEINRDRRLV